jgi:hypothetical protein
MRALLVQDAVDGSRSRGWQQKPCGVDGCPVIDLQAAEEFRPACRSAESPRQVHFAIQDHHLLMTDRIYVSGVSHNCCRT